MNDKTKDGLKLGGMISLLVGVISLIVIIPTIARIMTSPQDNKLEGYKIILNREQDFFISMRNLTNIEDDDLSSIDFQGNLDSYKVSIDYIEFNFNTFSVTDTIFSNSLTIYNNASVYAIWYFYQEDEVTPKPEGIYDFSDIIVIEQYQILNPIYTPF